MWRRLIDNRRFWICVIIVVLVATIIPASARAWRGHDIDFSDYWNAAQAMRDGTNIYSSGETGYIYPPLLAFVLQPLTLVRERTAAVMWIIISGLLTILAVTIVARESAVRLHIDLSKWPAIAATALLLTFDKIRSLMMLGQSDALTLLGFAGAFRWMEDKPWLAGLAVGASANVKYLSLIFVPYFLFKRFWSAAISSILFFCFFLFLPAVQIGLARAVEYARVALGGLTNMFGTPIAANAANVYDVAWNRSVSIPSTIFRFTRSHHWPDALAIIIIFLVFIATLAILVRIFRSGQLCSGSRKLPEPELKEDRRSSAFAKKLRPDKETTATITLLDFAALIVLALVFSPQTTSRHMVLLLLAFGVAVALFLAATEPTQKIAIGMAITLMFAALTLPPYGIGMNQAVWSWRAIGGASWCALIFLFVIVWAGGSVAAVSDRRIR